MAQEIKGKMEIAGVVGPMWFAGWLFTLGFAKLSFFKGMIAIVAWPYFIGRIVGG